MRLKRGVRLDELKPQTVLACLIAEPILKSHGVELVVTAGSDGTHKANSKHYSGEAFDIRSHDLDPKLRVPVVEDLKAALGWDFDVILEDFGGPNEHIHIEYDPKGV
jgi:hypothetical protein